MVFSPSFTCKSDPFLASGTSDAIFVSKMSISMILAVRHVSVCSENRFVHLIVFESEKLRL